MYIARSHPPTSMNAPFTHTKSTKRRTPRADHLYSCSHKIYTSCIDTTPRCTNGISLSAAIYSYVNASGRTCTYMILLLTVCELISLQKQGLLIVKLAGIYTQDLRRHHDITALKPNSVCCNTQHMAMQPLCIIILLHDRCNIPMC